MGAEQGRYRVIALMNRAQSSTTNGIEKRITHEGSLRSLWHTGDTIRVTEDCVGSSSWFVMMRLKGDDEKKKHRAYLITSLGD